MTARRMLWGYTMPLPNNRMPRMVRRACSSLRSAWLCSLAQATFYACHLFASFICDAAILAAC